MEKNELLETPHLIYVMDPMCTWCYGFAPVIKRLRDEYQEKLKLKVVVGGLRPGATTPLQADTPDNVQEHWQEVADTSGQAFNFGFFERKDFIYNTEPACRAIVAMRYLAPAHEFEMASEIQQAFYKLNQDVTNPAVLAAIASQFGVTEETFMENFLDAALLEKTQQDFMIARQLRAIAFPSLYLLNDKKISLISRGYKTYEAVKSRLAEALHDPLEK
ncbi:DsbA family protein [Pontibacter qinzhouensis]|uniref:DsbA family protein n=1 Tax=Pontibacter qinzhouensis TaxID=2603253 RepID=A0A5C8IVK7_9BACT|nr:DsbA family protein [Pontibacter qinzhouensis]TXK25021.1 DsbA family protein [Pontibacter qinzhouensis]